MATLNGTPRSTRPAGHAPAVFYLGVTDHVGELVDAPDGKRHPDVRQSAVYALRHCTSRGADSDTVFLLAVVATAVVLAALLQAMGVAVRR